MAQNYYFSPSTFGFYPVVLKAVYETAQSFPSDAVLVDDSVFVTYSAMPPAGKTRGSVDGAPAWITAT